MYFLVIADDDDGCHNVDNVDPDSKEIPLGILVLHLEQHCHTFLLHLQNKWRNMQGNNFRE